MRGTSWGCLFFVLCAAGVCAPAQAADGDVKFSGTFVWDNQKGKTHPIKATFTPNGDKKWTVVYSFTWKKEQAWKGTAEGDLATGELKGDANHPDQKRKFTFCGTFKNGQFECTHQETTGGKSKDTGSMTIKKE